MACSLVLVWMRRIAWTCPPPATGDDDDEGSDSVESRLKFMDEMERRAANEPSSDSSYRVLSADTDVCIAIDYWNLMLPCEILTKHSYCQIAGQRGQYWSRVVQLHWQRQFPVVCLPPYKDPQSWKGAITNTMHVTDKNKLWFGKCQNLTLLLLLEEPLRMTKENYVSNY